MDDKEAAQSIRVAMREGRDEDAIRLLRGHPNLRNMATVFGPWLHVAASFGRLSVAQELIALGADVNAQGGISGGGALNEAASNGHLSVVEFLLLQGATLDVDVSERNPLFSAIQGGHTDIAKVLIRSGIDAKIAYTGENMQNMDALAFAREWGRSDIVHFLQSGDFNA